MLIHKSGSKMCCFKGLCLMFVKGDMYLAFWITSITLYFYIKPTCFLWDLMSCPTYLLLDLDVWYKDIIFDIWNVNGRNRFICYFFVSCLTFLPSKRCFLLLHEDFHLVRLGQSLVFVVYMGILEHLVFIFIYVRKICSHLMDMSIFLNLKTDIKQRE